MRWVRRLAKMFAVLAVILFLFVLTGASDTLLFYARVARLYTQSPDSRLAMPLENLSKKVISDTWQAPRGEGRRHEGQDIFAALIGPDPPRYLLRLSGIESPWRPPDLDVGSPLIERVRTGLHSTPRGPELHVVLDLSTREVEHSLEVEGEALRVRLRSRTP